MHVGLYVCMYVCLHLCTFACIYVYTYVCGISIVGMPARTNARMHEYTFVCTYVGHTCAYITRAYITCHIYSLQVRI